MTVATATAGTTIGAELAAASARLAAAGVPEPRADAEVLLAHLLGMSRTLLLVQSRMPLAAAAAGAFALLLDRRAGREPVFQIVGEREFWSLPFTIDRHVLSPRPETELLVETACRVAPGARRVLDAGTGSGCVAVALARTLPAAQVMAIDRSAAALAVASGNTRRHASGVQLVRGDWLAAVRPASFDLVVANPPYVRAGDLAGLDPEVRLFEPVAALVAGEDGLDAVRALLADVPRVLVPGGWFVCEIGAGQGPAATGIAHSWAGRFDDVHLLSDHAGLDRVVAVRVRGN